MTEAEFEESQEEAIVPEILPERRFLTMVQEASLDEDRANYLVKNFSNHFKEAAEWAKKAKDIIVTNENQTVMMEIARTGRLFLAKKRQEIEKARKWMKEPALREGQAIDRIANLLKDTIIPTEEHLLRQENFVKLRKEAEEERIRLEVEKKMEEERIAKEKADAEALAISLEENRKLLELARVKEEEDRKFREEKKKELEAEREKSMRIQNELILRERAELQKEADRIRAEEKFKQGSDVEKMQKLYDDLKNINLPEVTSMEAKRIIGDSRNYIGLALLSIDKYIKANIQQEE